MSYDQLLRQQLNLLRIEEYEPAMTYIADDWNTAEVISGVDVRPCFEARAFCDASTDLENLP